MKTQACLVATVVVTAMLASMSWPLEAIALDRGHSILLDKGFQIQAVVAAPPGGLQPSRWEESYFTSPLLVGGISAANTPALNGQWGRWLTPEGDSPVRPSEEEFAWGIVNVQLRDEQPLNPANIAEAASYFSQLRASYPNVIGYTNQWGTQESVATMRNYMQTAQPDMLMFDTYGFKGNLLGGSPVGFYQDLQKYRTLSLEGNDGTGGQPIPFATYLQTFVSDFTLGHAVSESEVRLNQFGAWAFGAKAATAFYYIDGPAFPDLHSVLFEAGDDTPTTTFYEVAETNRQSRNLGSSLLRLISTDVRMKPGQHKVGSSNVANALPVGVSGWAPGADPFITSITATNLGTTNNGLPGDVVMGYFKPLDASFTNPGHENDVYFMLVNGLSSEAGTALDARQQLTVNFDFGSSGINSLQRMSRDTGLVEDVSLFHLGGSQYKLDLQLDGGTGDLFKFNNGGIFVHEPPSTSNVIFQDDFEGRVPGSLLGAVAPQVGSHYVNGGNARNTSTSPPGSTPAGGSIFAQGSMTSDDHRMFVTSSSQQAVTNQQVNFSFDFYIVGNTEAVKLVDINTFTDAGYEGRGLSFQLKSDGSIVYYDGSTHAVEGTFATDQWINVDVTADFGANTFSATAGDVNFGGNMNGAENFQSLLFYTQLSSPGPATYFYDNVLISLIDSSLLTGDYNDDGLVDAADYVIWRMNAGTNNTLPNNLLPGPIGQDHFNQWKANFGAQAGGGAATSVPEPTSLAVSLLAIVLSCAFYRNRT